MEMPSLLKLRCGRKPDPTRLRRTEECLGRLTVRRWRAGDRPGDLGPVDLVKTRQHHWGLRSWFACPRCRRRCGVLYQPKAGDGWACRRCHRLTYRSAQEAYQDERLWRAFDRIERHLESNDGWGEDAGFDALLDTGTTMERLATIRAILIMDAEDRRLDREALEALKAAAPGPA
jgi:hypothetical protein